MTKANFTMANGALLRLTSLTCSLQTVLTVVVMAFFGLSAYAQGGHLSCNAAINTSLGTDCTAELLPDDVLEGDPDPQLQYVVTVSATMTSNGNLGPAIPTSPMVNANYIGQTLFASVSDGVNSCWGTVSVEDKLGPVITCPAAASVVSCATPGLIGNATATDCSGAPTISHSDVVSGADCDLSKTVIRTYVATDSDGHTASCEQVISVTKPTMLDIVFPADLVIDCADADDYDNLAITGTPSVGGQSIYPNSSCTFNASYSDTPIPVCDGTIKYLRTWTVYDWCLPTNTQGTPPNPFLHIQLIKVVDQTGPEFDVADMTVSTDPYACSASLDLPNITITDDCSGIASFVAATPAGTINGNTNGTIGSITGLAVGLHTITYTVTDNCGNVTEKTFKIRVKDLTQPIAICDEFTDVNLGMDGTAKVYASTFDDGSYDNCQLDRMEVRRMAPGNRNCENANNNFRDHVTFCCLDVNDSWMVVFRVYDADNNYNDCMVEVTVNDKIRPVCTAPADVTVDCDHFDPSLWPYGDATAVDNCDDPSLDLSINYSQYDSTCSSGIIRRTWTAEDAQGNTGRCTQRITVEYQNDYYVGFPDDQTVLDCDDDGDYGSPVIYDEDCELIGISSDDQTFHLVPDACFKIERTWEIVNWCTYDGNDPLLVVPNPTCVEFGPVVSPYHSTTPNSLVPVGHAKATLWCGIEYSDYYETTYKLRDPVTLEYVIDPSTGLPMLGTTRPNGYSYKQVIKVRDNIDPIIVSTGPNMFCDFSDDNALYDTANTPYADCEADVDLSITATDACSKDQITFRAIVFLDLDRDGVMETVYNSDANPLIVQIYNIDRNGTEAIASLRIKLPSNFLPGNYDLPYGTHKVKWIIQDGCGNETPTETEFEVKDCKKPTIKALNGLAVNDMPNCSIELNARWFLKDMFDNCELLPEFPRFPGDATRLRIRRDGPITTVPGIGDTTVTFSGAADLGTQQVQLWAIDAAGNADYVVTYVIVQDNSGACGGPIQTVAVAGALNNDDVEGVEDADVMVYSAGSNGVPPISTSVSTTNGSFSVAGLPVGSSFDVMAAKNNDVLNGVTTRDLLDISKHLMGIATFDNPSAYIAADVNQDGRISAQDLAEIRKVILHIQPEFTSVDSWEFIDANHNFGAAPYNLNFVSVLNIQNANKNISNADFLAVKYGDVNSSAIANSLVAANRNAAEFTMNVDEQSFAAGDEVIVTFNTNDLNTEAYQFTMNFNADVLSFNNVEGDAAAFGLVNADNGVITTAAFGEVSNELFTVSFTAKQSGNLSNVLTVNSDLTEAVAYTDGADANVVLNFNGATAKDFTLYQNVPNPFNGTSTISFDLPVDASAILTVHTANGQVLKTISGDYAKGKNSIVLDAAELPAGVLYYSLNTENFSGTMKMIIME